MEFIAGFSLGALLASTVWSFIKDYRTKTLEDRIILLEDMLIAKRNLEGGEPGVAATFLNRHRNLQMIEELNASLEEAEPDAEEATF